MLGMVGLWGEVGLTVLPLDTKVTHSVNGFYPFVRSLPRASCDPAQGMNHTDLMDRL